MFISKFFFFSPDIRLRKFASEKKELQDEIRHLRLELEETRNRVRSERSSGSVLGQYFMRI